MTLGMLARPGNLWDDFCSLADKSDGDDSGRWQTLAHTLSNSLRAQVCTSA